MRPLILTTIFLSLTAPAFAVEKSATAIIINTRNDEIGRAHLVEGPRGVLIDLELSGLTPGMHGLHFHAVGTCDDAAAGFKDSQGHVQHDDSQHGLLNPEGPEAGDLPNIEIASNGSARAQFYSEMVSLDNKSGRENLLDYDGSALVVHAHEDNHYSQPIGNAGDRIACGVVWEDE